MANKTIKYICLIVVEYIYRFEKKLGLNGVATSIIKWEIHRNYKFFMHRDINLNNPIDLNEKINWLKLHDDMKMWGLLADKYEVREYVKKKGLEHILVPLYGVWDNARNIDFDNLPKSFVLKTNHGSGDIFKVSNKDEADLTKIVDELNAFLRMPYGVLSGEPHYLFIKPKVVAEQLMEPVDKYSSSLVDYKIWCFNGEPHHIWACYSRSRKEVKVESYDLNWKHHPEWSIFNDHYVDGGGIVPKPDNLDDMLDVARKLSKGLKQVRVDLYNQGGQIYFGEMTMTGNGGYMDFYTPEFLNEMGDLVNLEF